MQKHTLAAMLMLGLLQACSDDAALTVDACKNFAISFSTLDRFQQPVSSFGTTEVVRFEHKATNLSNREQTVNGTSGGCSGHIRVIDVTGNDIYADPRDPVFACTAVVTPFQLVFAPGEIKTLSVDWNQPRNGESRNLPAGSYTAEYRSSLDKCSSTFDKAAAFTLH